MRTRKTGEFMDRQEGRFVLRNEYQIRELLWKALRNADGKKMRPVDLSVFLYMLAEGVAGNCELNENGDFVFRGAKQMTVVRISEQLGKGASPNHVQSALTRLTNAGVIDRPIGSTNLRNFVTTVVNTKQYLEDKFMNADIFANNERIVINMAAQGTPVSEFGREGFLKNLAFQVAIATDEDVISMLTELREKVAKISDEEWEILRLQIPFPVFIDADSEVSEVPNEDENA